MFNTYKLLTFRFLSKKGDTSVWDKAEVVRQPKLVTRSKVKRRDNQSKEVSCLPFRQQGTPKK